MKYRYALVLPAVALVAATPMVSENGVVAREHAVARAVEDILSHGLKARQEEEEDAIFTTQNSEEESTEEESEEIEVGEGEEVVEYIRPTSVTELPPVKWDDHRFEAAAQYIYGLVGKLATWNTYGPVTDIQICSTLRATGGLAASLDEVEKEISTQLTKTKKDITSFDITLRGIEVWVEILEKLKVQLWETKYFSLDSQLFIANCYIEYSWKVAEFLKILQIELKKLDHIKFKHELCQIYEAIDEFYRVYKYIALVFYSEELIWGYFPEHIPTWWKHRCEIGPYGCFSIREWIRLHDVVILEEIELFYKPGFLHSHCGLIVGRPIIEGAEELEEIEEAIKDTSINEAEEIEDEEVEESEEVEVEVEESKEDEEVEVEVEESEEDEEAEAEEGKKPIITIPIEDNDILDDNDILENTSVLEEVDLEDVEETAEVVTKPVEEAVEDVEETVEVVTKPVEEAVEEVEETVEVVTKPVEEAVEEVEETVEVVTKPVEEAVEEVEETVEVVTKPVEEAVEGTGETVEAVTDKIGLTA